MFYDEVTHCVWRKVNKEDLKTYHNEDRLPAFLESYRPSWVTKSDWEPEKFCNLSGTMGAAILLDDISC